MVIWCGMLGIQGLFGMLGIRGNAIAESFLKPRAGAGAR